jgi:hypothetical protein
VVMAGPPQREDLEEDLGSLQTRTVGPFRQNIVITAEEVHLGETPESYVARQIEGLRQSNVSRVEVARPQSIQLGNGLQGLVTEQVILSPSGERIRQMQLVSIQNDIAYTLIGSHLDGAPFERTRDQFRQILLSFSSHVAGDANHGVSY